MVDSSVESAMGEASGAGGREDWRSQVRQARKWRGRVAVSSPSSERCACAALSQWKGWGVVMLVTVVSGVYPEIGSQVSSILLFLGI